MTDPYSEKTQQRILDALVKAISRDERVVFAYLYGSCIHGLRSNDVDIAVYAKADEDPHLLSADLKIALHRETGVSPDYFDVRVLNGMDAHCDLFGLLYLRDVLEEGRVLTDKDPDIRSDFLERYGSRFRECEGLIQEVLA
jgi:predicted nucleotidyltransferase